MKNILVAMLLLICGGCEINLIKPEKGIIGKWEWVSSFSSGWSFGLHTPESTGGTQRIEFDKNGNYNSYVNDTLWYTTEYSVEKDFFFKESKEKVTFIKFDNGSNKEEILYIKNDTLSLNDNQLHGSLRKYVRIR